MTYTEENLELAAGLVLQVQHLPSAQGHLYPRSSPASFSREPPPQILAQAAFLGTDDIPAV